MTCPLPPGQTQCLHEHDLLWLRALVEMQARMIADQERRLRGEPRATVEIGP